MEPVRQESLDGVVENVYAAACTSVCKHLRQNGYVLIKLQASTTKLLKNARLVFRSLFEDKWFDTAEARGVWLQQADGSASAPPQGTGYMQLPQKQLLQLQMDKTDAFKQISEELSGLELKVMKELDCIARKVLKAVVKVIPDVSKADAFEDLLGPAPSDLGDFCDSLLHANFYAATAPDPAAATAAAATVGHGARQVHVDRGFLTVITESAPGLLVQGSDGDMKPIIIDQSHVVILVGHSLQEVTQGWLKACSHGVSSAAGPRLSLAYKLHGKPDAIIDPDMLLKFPATSRKRTIREVEAELNTSIHVRKRARTAQQQAPAAAVAASTGTSTPNPQETPTGDPVRNAAQHHDATDLQLPPAAAKAAAASPAAGTGLQQLSGAAKAAAAAPAAGTGLQQLSGAAKAAATAPAADGVQHKCTTSVQTPATQQLAAQPDAHEAARLMQPAQAQQQSKVVQHPAAVIPPSNGAGQPSQPAINRQQVDHLMVTDVLLPFPQREVCIKLLQWKGEKYVIVSQLGKALSCTALRKHCGDYAVQYKDKACLGQLIQRRLVKPGTTCLLFIKASDVVEKVSQALQWPAEVKAALQRAVSSTPPMNCPHGALHMGAQQNSPQQAAVKAPQEDGAEAHRAVPGRLASLTGHQQASKVLMTVVVRDQAGHEIHFSVKGSTRFEKVFNAYCQKKSMNPEHAKFVFDGNKVEHNQTPQDLEMADGDAIDVMVMQVGD